MSRLPVPGGDDNQWGDILNDYLKASHNADGSLKPIAGSSLVDGTVAAAKLSSGVQTNLSDQRVPTDGSVTNAKVAANAAIARTKLASDVQDSLAKADTASLPGVYDARLSGVVADGTTDNRAMLVAAISTAAALDNALLLPPGVICNGGAPITLPSGMQLLGRGKTATTFKGAGFLLDDNCSVEYIGFDGSTAGSSSAIVSLTNVAKFDMRVANCHFENYQAPAVVLSGTADNSGVSRFAVVDNTFKKNSYSILVERAYDCIISGNRSVNDPTTGSHISFFGGSNNIITENTTVNGITGINFVYSAAVSSYAGKIFGNIISNNHIVNTSEEGICLDCRGNDANGVAAFDTGTVAGFSYNGSVPQMRVDLDSAFSSSGVVYYGFDIIFITGKLAGHCYSIDAHNGASFYLNRFDPARASDVQVGDEVVVGAALSGNVITGNNVIYSGTSGILLWGMGVGNIITNNTVAGNRTGSGATGTIGLFSLDGLVVSVRNSTGRSGKAPVMNNLVQHNRVQDTDVVLGIQTYGGATGYTSYLNRVEDNIYSNGSRTVDRHTLIGDDVARPITASTPGSVVKKVEVFDANGDSIGFVPIYDSIS